MPDDVSSLLAAKETELEGELAALSVPVETGTISFGKRIGDGTASAIDRLSRVGTHQQIQVTLTDVRRARAKLAEGTYGSCDSCGQPIALARLDALPWSSQCVRCAGKARQHRG
ncbi:MAG: TraR/DksA family transcriptional regulator [Mycobacteriales bacterium]